MAYLCEAYWTPLYLFARRTGADQQAAKDLVQGFFAEVLSREHPLGHVDRDKGRFRSYLLAAFRHYIARLEGARVAIKRGGAVEHLPIEVDFNDGERRYRDELVSSTDPEKEYQREWALTFLNRVLMRLRERYLALGDLELYDRLEPFLPKGDEVPPYEQLAKELRINVGTLKVALHRLRSRYREVLFEEAAEVVADTEDVEREIRDLLAILKS